MRMMRWRYTFLLISLCVILPGLFSIWKYGFRPSIDFTGGSVLELQFPQVADKQTPQTQAELQTIIGEEYQVVSVQHTGQDRVIVKGGPLSEEQKNTVLAKLQAQVPGTTEQRFETVGPILGAELLRKTLTAGAFVVVIITLFVGRQFHNIKFGVSAVLAMLHDTLVLLGSFSLMGYFFGIEVDVLFVTALLTTLSFSVHDTIVVFDRVREMQKHHPKMEFRTLVDAAVIQTLSRSLNNSLTIILMLVALYVMGGDSIRNFVLALLIGAVTGTYSSTFTAAPLLVIWDEVGKKLGRK